MPQMTAGISPLYPLYLTCTPTSASLLPLPLPRFPPLHPSALFPPLCRYVFTTTDGGLTGSIEYCGTTGAACITEPCRGELSSAIDMGVLHMYGHGFESATEQAEPNMSAVLTQVLPP